MITIGIIMGVIAVIGIGAIALVVIDEDNVVEHDSTVRIDENGKEVRK